MKFYSRIVALTLPLLFWITATLSMGGVAAWFERTYLLWVWAVCTVLFLVYIERHEAQNYQGAFLRERKFIFAIALITLVSLFQLVPFPEKILHLLSPISWELYYKPLNEIGIPKTRFGYPISLDPASTIQFIKDLLASVLFFAVLLETFRSQDLRRYFAYGITSFAALVAILGTSHRFTFSQTILWLVPKIGPIFGPYVNANHAAALLGIGCVMSFGILYQNSNTFQRTLFSVFCGICALGIFHTGSRSGILATGVAILIQIQWKVKNSQRDPMVKKFLLPALFIAIFLAFLWQAPAISRLTLTAKSIQTGQELRSNIWRDAFQFFEQSPIFGIGMGAFSKASPIASQNQYFLHSEHVENEYLELLCSGGLIAFFAGMLLLLFLIRKLIYIFSATDISTITRVYALGLLVLLIQSLFVFHAPLPAHQILFMILLAGTLATHRFTIFAFPNRKKRFLVFSSTIFLLGLWTLFTPNKNEGDLPPFSIFSMTPSGRAERLLFANESEQKMMARIGNNPMDSTAWYGLAISKALLENPGESLEAYNQAVKLNPYLSHHRILVATSLSEVKAFDQASKVTESLYKDASPLNPTLLSQLHLNSARYAYLMNDKESAQNHLIKAKTLNPDNWRVSLLEAFLNPSGLQDFVHSWQKVKDDPNKGAAWDQALENLLVSSKDKVDVLNLIQSVAPERYDIGIFLDKFSRFLPKKSSSLFIRLGKNLPIPRLKMLPERIQENTTWSTPLDPYQTVQEFDVKVKNTTAEFDIYYLPVHFLLAPDSLSFRIQVKSSRTLSTQMVLIIDGKPVVSPQKPKRVAPDLWEFEWANVGKSFPTTKNKYHEMSGIGFTPLERDGRYGIGQTEVFIETTL